MLYNFMPANMMINPIIIVMLDSSQTLWLLMLTMRLLHSLLQGNTVPL
jgi:hypothetical protein